MLKNYIKVALRTILKHKGYSIINIIGLAIGISCCMLILLYVRDELSFDRYHKNADRIYRVIEEVRLEGVGEESSSMPFPTGDTLPLENPDLVEAIVRFFNFQLPTVSLEYGTSGENRFNEPRFFYADAAVLHVFDFPLIEGDPRTALKELNSIIITKAMVRKYFDNEDPMGKTLRWQNGVNLTVTGVAEDVHPNSHFQFDFLASFSTLNVFCGFCFADCMYQFYEPGHGPFGQPRQRSGNAKGPGSLPSPAYQTASWGIHASLFCSPLMEHRFPAGTIDSKI